MAERPPSDLVQKNLPCPDLAGEYHTTNGGGEMSAALYTDDRVHCFSCKGTWSGARLKALGFDSGMVSSDSTPKAPPSGDQDLERDLAKGKPKTITSRKITLQTCKRWGYVYRTSSKGTAQELMPVRNPSGALVGIKVRDRGVDGLDKNFFAMGTVKGQLIGRHMHGPGQKRTDGKASWVLICEGEYDAMSVDQAMDGKYPVVSIPAGVDSAAEAIKQNLEWLLTFDRVILGFDQDGPGRDATEECVKLLPTGRAYIARWPEKDPNELLKQDRSAEITRIVWNPTPYRPDGMIDARDLTEACMAPVVRGLPWPWDGMTDLTYGRRPEEVYTFGSGTGMGKSDLIAEVIAGDLRGRTKWGTEYEPQPWALFSFEGGGGAKLKNTIAGKIGGKRFHKAAEDCAPGFEWTPEEKRGVLDMMDTTLWNRGGKLFIYDSRGSSEWDSLKDKMRQMAHLEGVKHFLLDPLSAMVTESEQQTQELDRIVLQYTKLMEELHTFGYLVSHLRRPSIGPTHEEGGQVSLGQFRGSNGIGQFTSFAFGQERNQQADTDEERNTNLVRVVKDRFTGDSTGLTFKLHYNRFTGSLDEPAPKGDEII